jgi:hypothetical protein
MAMLAAFWRAPAGAASLPSTRQVPSSVAARDRTKGIRHSVEAALCLAVAEPHGLAKVPSRIWEYSAGTWGLKVDRQGAVDLSEPTLANRQIAGEERVRIQAAEDRFFVFYSSTPFEISPLPPSLWRASKSQPNTQKAKGVPRGDGRNVLRLDTRRRGALGSAKHFERSKWHRSVDEHRRLLNLDRTSDFVMRQSSSIASPVRFGLPTGMV